MKGNADTSGKSAPISVDKQTSTRSIPFRLDENNIVTVREKGNKDFDSPPEVKMWMSSFSKSKRA